LSDDSINIDQINSNNDASYWIQWSSHSAMQTVEYLGLFHSLNKYDYKFGILRRSVKS